MLYGAYPVPRIIENQYLAYLMFTRELAKSDHITDKFMETDY